eukprot:TRINITY_DN5141_c1_g1_i17.p2 TRINITY_DN5141_c1_g1~~TRINITY_DN5141_c1_g1_i17.p2  ORF type:complete len:110 (+),score=10.41 TRINITY_DN5141_c1_g1_i17:348-677(+)
MLTLLFQGCTKSHVSSRTRDVLALSARLVQADRPSVLHNRFVELSLQLVELGSSHHISEGVCAGLRASCLVKLGAFEEGFSGVVESSQLHSICVARVVDTAGQMVASKQ